MQYTEGGQVVWSSMSSFDASGIVPSELPLQARARAAWSQVILALVSHVVAPLQQAFPHPKPGP
jgi:hypothetical protein